MPTALAQSPLELDKRSSVPDSAPVSLWGRSISIKGSVVSGEDLYIDGNLEGLIDAAGSIVTVGPNATLTASIKARRIVISGTVHGPILATESVELRATAKLIGNVSTPRISMEDGAYFKGSIDMSRGLDHTSSPSGMAPQEQRYSKLVDMKYVRGLTNAEEAEFESLALELSALNAAFSEPVLERLAAAPVRAS